MYARAWERDFGRPVLDANKNNVTLPNPSENAVRSDFSTEEKWNTQENSQERLPAVFPLTEDLCDVTDTYPYMEIDEDTRSE